MMKMEMLLQFNADKAYSTLIKALSREVENLLDTVRANAVANLGWDPFYYRVKGEDGIQAKLLDLATDGLISGQVSSDMWESWLAEWGSGSEMDTSNPDLTAYMGSELWNPARNGFAITGRPKGEYIGLDGEVYDSSGALAGVNLETLVETDPDFAVWAEENFGPDAFKPKPPLHFMRDALESNRNLIINQLNGILQSFDVGAFFV